MSTVSGILLPESVLVSPWFLLLATIVAFNTVIYVGLTFAKLIPWPQQFHPSEVRARVQRLGITIDEESVMRDIPTPTLPEGEDPYDQMRSVVAKRDIPQAFALAGGMVVVFTAVSALAFRDLDLWIYPAGLALGVGYLVLAVVLGHRDFRGRTMMWMWALASLSMVLLLLLQALASGSQFPLTYALVAMTAYFPVTLAWRPAVTVGVVMLTGVGLGSVFVPGVEDLRILAMAGSCLLIGAALLRLRLRALDALADEQARSEALASTDSLTGVLSRRGVMTLVPGLAANAKRAGQDVCVIAVDIQGLAELNTKYGMAYGDDVLRAVADVLRVSMREGDLVGRWSGGEFLVVGLGQRPDPIAMAGRLENAVRLTGVALGKPDIGLSVLTVAGDPGQTTFDALIEHASAEAVLDA